jgi:hypothetical protein
MMQAMFLCWEFVVVAAVAALDYQYRPWPDAVTKKIAVMWVLEEQVKV